MQHYPNSDPKAKGKIFNKPNKSTGKLEQWVKVYNHEDGVESFSEAESEGIEKERVIDDGRLVLDDLQIDEAYDSAVKLGIASISQGGHVRGQLEQENMAQRQKDVPKSPEVKDEPADDDEPAPLCAGLNLTPTKKGSDPPKDMLHLSCCSLQGHAAFIVNHACFCAAARLTLAIVESRVSHLACGHLWA
eukprot:10966397-Alexandrium_andersonii.AAC.2